MSPLEESFNQDDLDKEQESPKTTTNESIPSDEEREPGFVRMDEHDVQIMPEEWIPEDQRGTVAPPMKGAAPRKK